MKVKKIGIIEILRRIRLFSANNIKSSESGSKQPTQLIIKLNSSSNSTSLVDCLLTDSGLPNTRKLREWGNRNFEKDLAIFCKKDKTF